MDGSIFQAPLGAAYIQRPLSIKVHALDSEGIDIAFLDEAGTVVFVANLGLEGTRTLMTAGAEALSHAPGDTRWVEVAGDPPIL